MEWIKYPETKPHDEQRVLVCVDGIDVFDGMTYWECENGNGGSFVDDDGNSFVIGIITHWQPLPSPPED